MRGDTIGASGTSNTIELLYGKSTCDSSCTYLCCITLSSYETTKTYSSNGASQGEVTSTNPNAYPNNGYQGGKWYVLQGVR